MFQPFKAPGPRGATTKLKIYFPFGGTAHEVSAAPSLRCRRGGAHENGSALSHVNLRGGIHIGEVGMFKSVTV